MIAAPAGGGGEHLQALAKLSSVLMNPEAKAALLQAGSADEVVEVFKKFEEPQEEAVEEVTEEATPSNEDVYVLAVTACQQESRILSWPKKN